MINFLKNNWLSIFGLIIGVVGLYYSYYFYEQSKSERQPIFVVDPQRTQILSEKTLISAPIKVFTSNGREICSGLTSVRFYFWNMGKISIRPNNILEPLKISIADSNARIIDFKILKSARPISKVSLKYDSLSQERKIEINLNILEKNDGITGQIIYEGNPKSKINISGVIEGTSAISESENDIIEPSISDYFRSLGVVWFFSLIIFLGVIINSINKKLGPMENWPIFSNNRIGKFVFQKIFKWTLNILGVLIIALFIALIIFGIIIDPVKKIKEENRKTIVEKVPPSVFP